MTFLAACAPSETAVQTSIAETQAAYTPTSSATPIPTNTLQPTGTPTPQPTTDTYLPAATKAIQEYIDAYQVFLDQVQLLGVNPGLSSNQQWIDETDLAMAKLELAADGIDKLRQQTGIYEYLHASLKAIASETHLLIKNFTSGINNQDLNAINRATDNMTLISQYIQIAASELKKFK